jgi:outer membrane immunogenic protein
VRKLSLVVFTIASVGSIQIALAADMPVKASPVAISSNWTGFYIGGSLGGRWTSSDWTTTCLSSGAAGGSGCPLNANFVPGATNRFANNNPTDFNSSSLRAGLYGGYNWQFSSRWVAGIEGDFAWANNNKMIAGIPGAEDPTVAGSPGLDTSTVKETWDAGIRGRLGYLINPTLLLFATGGVSWTHLEASAFCGSAFSVGWCGGGAGTNVGSSSTSSATMAGWTVGGGLEWMWQPHWLVRAEYRYTDYGTFNYTLFAGPNAGSPGINLDAIAASVKVQTNTATLGLAYKF